MNGNEEIIYEPVQYQPRGRAGPLLAYRVRTGAVTDWDKNNNSILDRRNTDQPPISNSELIEKYTNTASQIGWLARSSSYNKLNPSDVNLASLANRLTSLLTIYNLTSDEKKDLISLCNNALGSVLNISSKLYEMKLKNNELRGQ